MCHIDQLFTQNSSEMNLYEMCRWQSSHLPLSDLPTPGMLSADDPEVKEGPPGVGGSNPPSAPQCVFCTNAQSVEKCQPAAEQLNGSCSPDVSYTPLI